MTKSARGGPPLQASLDGFDTPSGPTDRLFFGFFPDANAAAQVDRLAGQLRTTYGLKGKPLKMEHFHITLHHLGDFAGLPPSIVAMAQEAGQALARPPFEITLDRAMSFDTKGSNNPCVLLGGEGVAALKDFQLALGVAMAKAGLKVSQAKSGYTPHMTLTYDPLRVEQHVIESVSWTAREFVLVHSLLGKTTHVPLARWALRT